MIRIAFISIAAFLALPFYAQHAVSQPGDICNPNFVLLIAQRANNYFKEALTSVLLPVGDGMTVSLRTKA